MMKYKFKTKPFQHQLIALERCAYKKDFALFMEMGTGKSKVLIDNISMLYDNGKIDGALIIAPKGVYKNWFAEEIPNHMPDHVRKKVVLWQTNKTKKFKNELKSLLKVDDDLHILIMNVEALSKQSGMDEAQRFLRTHKTLIAVDESTTIKSPTAIRTKNIIKLSGHATYRRILTGSPVTKSPLDLYTQCYFLDPHLLGFYSFYAFRNRYALMRRVLIGGRRVELVAAYQRLDELEEKLKPFSFRVLKDECLDLPDKVWTKRFIQLTEEQKKLYDQMRTTALALLNGKAMTTTTVLTQLMRLHQITCGHMKTDDGEVIKLKNERLGALMDILDEVQGKVIIWANYLHDIESIKNSITEKYGEKSVVTYYGGTDVKKRQDYIKAFQTNKEVKYLIGNPLKLF